MEMPHLFSGSRSEKIAGHRIPCYFCGDIADSREHLVPRCRGGAFVPDNVVPACVICNSMKGPRTVKEFVAFCELLPSLYLRAGSEQQRAKLDVYKVQVEKIRKYFRSTQGIKIKATACSLDPISPRELSRMGVRGKNMPPRLICLGGVGLCGQQSHLKICPSCLLAYCGRHFDGHLSLCSPKN